MCLLAPHLRAAEASVSEPSPAIQELRRHMLDREVNTLTFRSMDTLFMTRKVGHAGTVWQLPRATAPLDFSYEFEGKTYAAAEGLQRTYTNAFLVMKDGRIVNETYLNHSGPDTHFISWSMAKSITSTLIGLAVSDGLIKSIDDPIVQYLPELKQTGYAGVTIRQALQMRSGVAWDERYDFGANSPAQQAFERALVQNQIRYADSARTLGRAHAPGEVFNYSTVETAVLGWLLERAVKRPIAFYMAERLWEPLGTEADGLWILDGPPGVGREFTGAGFNAVLRDYARFGQMFLDEGRANGKQIVPAAWVRQATVPAAAVSAGQEMGYGLQWWTVAGTKAYTALGLQGQFIYVDPETRSVIVKLSYFPPGDPKAEAESAALLRAASLWKP
jgi:hypothetical protein